MPKWLKIIAKAAEKVTEVLIYDQIGEDWFGRKGVEAEAFALALKEVPEDHKIVVGINSPGGNVWDGLAIYHMLLALYPRVKTRIDGIAASISSIIALGGELEMHEQSVFMFHDPATFFPGGATVDDMRVAMVELDGHANNLAAIYAKKSKRTREQMRLLMRATTYLNGTQAKDIGFADSINNEMKLTAFAPHLEMLARFNAQQTAIQSGDKTTEKDMKPKLIAILAKLGVKVADDATEEQLFAQLKTALDNKPDASVMASIATELSAALAAIQAAAKPAPADGNIIDLKAIQAKLDANEKRLEQERVKRITNELNAVIADGRGHIDAKEWLPRCIADETLLATLKAMPQVPAGLEPIAIGASDKGNSFIEDYRKMKPGKERNDYRIANHEQLEQANSRYSLQPRAANTINSALLPDYLSDALVVIVWNRLASLRAYSNDFGINVLKPLAKVQVRKATVGSTAQTNATNFESGNSTLANIAITVNQITSSFQVANSERNSGHRLSHLAEINALVFADAISDVVTALIISANFGAAGGTNTIGVASSFAASGMPLIFALGVNFMRRNLILDGSYIARILPQDRTKFALFENGAFGFDGIFMNNRWTGTTANTVGFLADPRAIAVASGLPESGPPGEFVNQGTVASDAIPGLTVQTNEWFSRAGRVNWASYDVMFGAAAGDTTAGKSLYSA